MVASVWQPGCQLEGMLRITTTIGDRILLKLEGRLVGPWVDELRNTVWRTNGEALDIDVEDLTFADDDGERALAWLHRMGARFQGKGPYSEYLLERLKIPLHARQTALNNSDGKLER